MPKIFAGVRVVAPFCPLDMVVRILSHPTMHCVCVVGGGLRVSHHDYLGLTGPLVTYTYRHIIKFRFRRHLLSFFVCKGFLKYVTWKRGKNNSSLPPLCDVNV